MREQEYDEAQWVDNQRNQRMIDNKTKPLDTQRASNASGIPAKKVLQLNEAGTLGQANINFLRDSRNRIRVMGLGLRKPSLNRGKESFQITNFPKNPSPKAWQTMFRCLMEASPSLRFRTGILRV